MQGLFDFFGQPNNKQKEETDEFKYILDAVSKMPNDGKTRQIVQKHKSKGVPLDIMNIVWEDTGRNAFSSVGPNISDMTLQVKNTYLPVIRHQNFSDFTLDVDSDNIFINVGNQMKNANSKQISLTNYLSNFNKFCTKGQHLVKGRNLMKNQGQNERIIVSAQACILPVQKGGETKFNVALYNYQARVNDPAVLTIISTKAGSSAQIIQPGTQALFFNNQGDKCSFVAERASDFKETLKKEGKMESDEQIQQAEQLVKEMNVIYVFQVPLKQKEIIMKKKLKQQLELKSMKKCYRYKLFELYQFANRKRCKQVERKAEYGSDDEADMEDAVIKIGEKEGEFGELFGLDVERDTRFPIRLTLQFYKASGDGLINNTLMQEIAQQIETVENMGYNFRSLVTGEQIKMEIEEQYIPKCHQFHQMGMLEQNVNVYQQTNGVTQCDLCDRSHLYKDYQYFHCHTCGFDLCLNCSNSQQDQWNQENSKKCANQHNLFKYIQVCPENQPKNSLVCAQCLAPKLQNFRSFYNCGVCKYNICLYCYYPETKLNQVQQCSKCNKNDQLIPIVYGKKTPILQKYIQGQQVELFNCQQQEIHPEVLCKRCQLYS